MNANPWISVSWMLVTAIVANAAVPVYQLDDVLDAPGSTSVDLSPNGSTIVAKVNFGTSNDDGFRLFSADSHEVIREFHVPGVPWAGRVSADGNYIWSSRYYGGHVSKLDITNGSIVSDHDLGSWTDSVVFDSQRRFLYAGENDPGTGAIGSIQKLDTLANAGAGDVIPPPVGLNGEPGRVKVSTDDQYVFTVTRNAGSETLYKIRTSDMQVVGTTPPGLLSGVGDTGFSLNPDASIAYVPDEAADSIHVIDTNTMLEIDVFSVNSARGFFASPDGSHALVTGLDAVIRVFDFGSEIVTQSIDLPDMGIIGENKFAPYWDLDGATGAVFVPIKGPNGGVVVLVPEPGSLVLLASGVLIILHRRRSRRLSNGGSGGPLARVDPRR